MAPRARPRPGGAERRGGGTWATELHGGSDIGATTTVARKEGDHFRLNGLKWFTSNPIGGIAVATARPEGALAAVVRSAYNDCREAIGYVQGDSMEARRHARKLLGLMADTLAVGLLLEEVREGSRRGRWPQGTGRPAVHRAPLRAAGPPRHPARARLGAASLRRPRRL